MTEKEFLSATIQRWKRDPVAFVRECFGADPDRWQIVALMAVANPATRRLGMKACKGPGKTAVLAWIVLWFLTCHYEAKVGCTSITEANIRAGLWTELHKWMSRSRFMMAAFVWTSSKVARRGHPGWYAELRTWPKSGNPEAQSDALAGLHADNIMFVLDEVGGIPQAVMVTAEAVLATHVLGGREIVVIAGNPTHTTGPLYRACTIDAHLWVMITITGDPDDPERSPRIDLEWAREEIRKYGRDNPWVMVNVLGQFPPASINALLGVEEVEAAMRRAPRRDEYEWAQKRLGVDVARFGDDQTVIAPRQGMAAFKMDVIRQQRTTFIAARVARAQNLWGAELILVDDTGHWGHGVIDNLTDSGRPVIPVNYAERSSDKRYGTVRDLIHLEMAKFVKKGGSLPNDPQLKRQLIEPTYTFIGGKFVVEAKDEVKKRLGESPDKADALATTFAIPDLPAAIMEELSHGRTARHDFNPYEDRQEQYRRTSAVGRHDHDFDPLQAFDE